MFNCETCKDTFKTKRILSLHRKRQDCEKLSKCDDCPKSFKTEALLLRHKDSCSGVDYTCVVCNKNFPSRYRLKCHQILHANMKAFKCTHCKKGFNTVSVLNVHKRTHTGDRNFKCTDCDKRFVSSAVLSKHKNVHSEKKPFKCDCGKSFKSYQSLYRHTDI